MRPPLRLMAPFALLIASWSTLLAQETAGATLRGRVLNAAGAPLAGAVLSLSRGVPGAQPLTGLSGIDGVYEFARLLPGESYALTVILTGYATVIAGPLALSDGRETRLDVNLRKTEDLEETISVEARGDVVDTSSAITSTTFNSEFVESIPLVGRSFSDLLTLAPGVTDPDGDGNLNVRGARDTGLQLRLDGSSLTDPLTGHTGEGVNLEAVEELEVITGAAPAEFGRADGGFASVITKSGGNETTGSVKAFYRSQFLDGPLGDEAGAAIAFTDINLYGTLGGALVKDHLWYFAALERLDEERPLVLSSGETVLQGVAGWRNFAKLTWQASPRHKLAFQVHHDPLEWLGNNLGTRIAPESDYQRDIGGTLPQFTWTAVISPQLLMQTVLSHLDSGVDINPVSGDYREIDPNITIDEAGTRHVAFPCLSRNCLGDRGVRRVSFEKAGIASDSVELQREDGAYNIVQNSDMRRTTMRSDLSYTIEDVAGQHGIKSGFQFELESYTEALKSNPVLTDRTCRFPTFPCLSPMPSDWRMGSLELQVFDPAADRLDARSFNFGVYAQDAWKPVPNLSLQIGLRIDREEVDSSGFTSFDPLPEARRVLANYDAVCEAAGSGCAGRTPGRLNGTVSSIIPLAPDSPARKFDLNGDGFLDNHSAEGDLIYAPFTTEHERLHDTILIVNNNLAPRFSVSWDPQSNGKNRLFSSWGRYYDRLFLGTVVTDQRPSWFVARWELGNTLESQVEPGELSGEPNPVNMPGDVHIILSTRALSIAQTDRALRTPYVEEFTAGFEREIAPEWAASITYIHRKGRDLLQDMDLNHITCDQFDESFGVSPDAVCEDEPDRFGRIVIGVDGHGHLLPNGAPDLYVLNPNFNQILRVGNFNASLYTAWEAVLRKRLHRNWQMQVAYTWSRSTGEAESFTSLRGNDPAVSDRVSGFLSYDQRHVLKFQAVTHLPRGILLGSTVEWASGLPYSLISNVEDYDDRGFITPQRVFSLTGKLNDQRNDPQLTWDARIEKRFNLARFQMAAFLAAENILDTHERVLSEVDGASGIVLDGRRRPGRRFELGASVLF